MLWCLRLFTPSSYELKLVSSRWATRYSAHLFWASDLKFFVLVVIRSLVVLTRNFPAIVSTSGVLLVFAGVGVTVPSLLLSHENHVASFEVLEWLALSLFRNCHR